MIRPIFLEALGHVVHARMSMDTLQQAIIEEMTTGYRPTFRGHAWDVAQFSDLAAASHALDAAFSLMKAIQFPEPAARAGRLVAALRQLDEAKDQAGNGGSSPAQLGPGNEVRELTEDVLNISPQFE